MTPGMERVEGKVAFITGGTLPIDAGAVIK